MSAEITFDAENHIYYADGYPIPSVTQALGSAGIINTEFFTEEARERGTYVHKAVELYHKGGLNISSLDSVIRPYFEAYLDFLKMTNFRPLYVEKLVFDPVYQYGGTLDLVGPLSGNMSIIDIKTGAAQRWTGAQLAAYRAALHKTVNIEPIVGKYALELRSNGKWSLKPFTSTRDFDVFLAALTINNFKAGRI
jgi:hypothetical protein